MQTSRKPAVVKCTAGRASHTRTNKVASGHTAPSAHANRQLKRRGQKAGKGPQQRAGREAGSVVRAQKGGAQLGCKRPEKEVDRECPVTAPDSPRQGQAAGEKSEKGVEQGKGASPPRPLSPGRGRCEGRREARRSRTGLSALTLDTGEALSRTRACLPGAVTAAEKADTQTRRVASLHPTPPTYIPPSTCRPGTQLTVPDITCDLCHELHLYNKDMGHTKQRGFLGPR